MKFLQDLLNCAGEGNEYLVVGVGIIVLVFFALWLVN